MKLEKTIFHQVGLWSRPIELDFHEGFTIILGDNEAGKSTAMRALNALLFGVNVPLAKPLKRADFHAESFVRTPKGERLGWTRRGTGFPKEAKQSEEVSALLSDLLSDRHRPRFESLFHLGHADIGGGPELLRPDGQLGSIIYAASTGVNVSLVDATLRQLDDALQNLRGKRKNVGIGYFLQELNRVEEELRKAVRFAEYSRATQAVDVLDASLEANSKKEQALVHRLSEIQKRLKWTEIDEERRNLSEELAQLLEGREVPRARLGEDLRIAWKELDDADAALSERIDERQEVEANFRSLGESPELALYAGELEEIERDVSRVRDQEKRTEELIEQIEQERASIARLLGGSSSGEASDALLERGRAALLDEALSESLEAAINQGDEIDRNLESAREALKKSERERDALPPPPAIVDIKPLEQAEQLVGPIGERERAIEALKKHASAAKTRAERQRDDLGLAALELGAIRALELAPRERLDALASALKDAERGQSDAEAELRRAEGEASAARLALLEEEAKLGAIPSDEELERARAERERAWTALRGSLSHASSADELRAERVREFEAAMRKVDEIMERRFEGATRLGEIAEKRRIAGLKEAQIPTAKAAHEAAKKERDTSRAAWREAWPFLAHPPSEHTRWLQDLAALRDDLADAERALNEATIEEEAAGAALDDLRLLLKSAALSDEQMSAGGQALRTSAALSRVIRDELDERRQKNEAARKAVSEAAGLEKSVQDSKRVLSEQHERQREFVAGWTALIERLPAGIEAEREAIRQALRTRKELAHLLSALERDLDELDQLRRAIERFEDEARKQIAASSDAALALNLHLPDGLGLIPTIQTLAKEAKEAVERTRAIKHAERELEKQRAAEQRANEKMGAASFRLRGFWTETGWRGEPNEALVKRAAQWADDAFRLSQRVRDIETELSRIAHGIEGELGDRGLRELKEDEEDLHAQIKTIATERGELRQRRQRALEEREERSKSDPRELTAQREEAREILLRRADEIASLETAIFLLQRAQKRAESAAEPLIERASEIFARLTGGRYERILLNEEMTHSLQARSVSGFTRDLDELSDGTRDQLWLSLRLATALRAHAETPFPLILDDILVHFDEARTAAALELFAELSERIQIVLFTHHDHVAHRAAEVIPGRYSLHLLARPHESNEGPDQESDKILSGALPALDRPKEMPARTLEEPRPRQRRGEILSDEEYELILEILSASPEREFTKGELVDDAAARGFEISDDVWRAIANRMKDEPKVEITGERRGTRYRFLSSLA